MADESIEELALIGKLAYAPVEYVCSELKEYGEKLQAESLTFASESLEMALLSRHDPTINFALAQYGGHKDTLRALYERSGVDPNGEIEAVYLRALRIAVLSNTSYSEVLSSSPESIIGEDETNRIIRDGVDGEGYAVFTNPRLNNNHLKNILFGEGIYAEIPENRRQLLVRYLGRNPRVNDDQSSEHGPDMSFWNIHKGILHMIASVPTTRGWLIAIRDFLEVVNPFFLGSPDGKGISDTIKRWKTISDFNEEDRNDDYLTGLNYIDAFCCELAAIFGHYRNNESGYSVVSIGSMDSDDLLERCAYYGNAALTVKEMDTAIAKDAEVYVLAVLQNRTVLTDKETRYHLESEQVAGDMVWQYRRQCKKLAEKVKYFDPTPVSEWLNENLEEQVKEEDDEMEERKPEWAKEIERTQVELAKLVTEVGDIAKQTKSYVFVIILVIIVYAIGRYF